MSLPSDYVFTRTVLSTEIRGESEGHDWQTDAALEVAFGVGPDPNRPQNVVRPR